MKVWYGHGSEHSANLVIIGEFKTEDDAERIERLIANVTAVVEADAEEGKVEPGEPVADFSDRLMELAKRENFYTFTYTDPGELLYEYSVARHGNRIVITTEDQQLSALLRMLIHGSAKVEIYSAHDYPSEYGRPTHGRG